MRSKGKTSPISYYDKLSGKTVLAVLFLLALFIRFPFFFRDYIDRDESTFILVGQALADGYLPYTFLWDLKPPLVFFIIGGLISIFGKSFIAIRLFGTIAVCLTAFFTYKIGGHVFSKKIGIWSSLGAVLLLSLFGSLQGVMSEHISMLFFIPGLYFLVKSRNNSNVVLSGLLIGMALMTKINLAYAALFLTLFLLVAGVRTASWKQGLMRSLLFGASNLIVILLTLLPYYLTGKADAWWKSVFLAPLEYTSAEPFSPEKILPFIILITAFFLFAWKKHKLNFENPNAQLLLIALAGVCFSFIKGGKVNGHYLIQVYPILLLFVGAFLSALPHLKKWNWAPVMLVLLFLLPVESYREYYAIITHKRERGTYFNGEGIRVPQYLLAEGLNTENVLFLEYHIGYWLLDKMPPTLAATHPSNLCREELFPFFDNPRRTTIEELKFIMEDLKPATVVIRKNKRIFDKEEVEANQYVQQYLQKFYALQNSIDA
ncbi:MAG: glycosyltransferase, partial [Eudoraea sp.]|nr:glycosyltransferase family 39 protein [Eudoraea sp.]NNJ40454.1 glycosyltransferase [Eudoraea sp.]